MGAGRHFRPAPAARACALRPARPCAPCWCGYQCAERRRAARPAGGEVPPPLGVPAQARSPVLCWRCLCLLWAVPRSVMPRTELSEVALFLLAF